MKRSTIRKAMTDNRLAWPTGNAIATFRALARRGLANETTGVCEGCASHRAGHEVPVFEVPDMVAAMAACDCD